MNNLIRDCDVRVGEILVEVMDEVSWLRTGCAAISCAVVNVVFAGAARAPPVPTRAREWHGDGVGWC